MGGGRSGRDNGATRANALSALWAEDSKVARVLEKTNAVLVPDRQILFSDFRETDRDRRTGPVPGGPAPRGMGRGSQRTS